jgi:hypothetical protein
MIAAFVFFLAGVVGAMLISESYYSWAARELRREAEDLRKYSALMLRGMERAGWVEFRQDKDGRILGLDINPDFRLPARSDYSDTVKLQSRERITSSKEAKSDFGI